MHKERTMRKRSEIDSDEDFMDMFGLTDVDSKMVQTNTFTQQLITIYIDRELGTPDEYRAVFNALQKAQEYDVVKMVLNTQGGCLDTAMQLYHYLLETQATTYAEIHNAYSAGAIIALACDEIEVARYGSMMIHSIIVQSFGKMHEMDQQVTFTHKHAHSILSDVFDGFLTNKEIQSVIKGKDIWLSEAEIVKRSKKWIPIRKRNIVVDTEDHRDKEET